MCKISDDTVSGSPYFFNTQQFEVLNSCTYVLKLIAGFDRAIVTLIFFVLHVLHRPYMWLACC